MTLYQQIAVSRVKGEESREWLLQWWSNKFKLPTNHPLLLAKTWEELYVDFLTDYYSTNPEALKQDSSKEKDTWQGYTSDEYEEQIKKKLERLGEVDLSQWKEEPKEFDDNYEVS